ncbi:MAG: F420-0--gamma-glutamyl ligase, partial [Oscillospiraceae bacterium]|nr:F420-0--gamma-glutamyl ligase [Oscillospiraceae bacterium]
MGIIASRNIEDQKRRFGDITYFDRGRIEGGDGGKYDRFAIQTHFIERREDKVELVKRYVLPMYQPGDVLSFGAKVMAMCVDSVREKKDVKPGFWANRLWPFAGINHTGVGMHEPHKLQLVIDIVGLPRVLFGAAAAAVTRPFGVHGLFYKICGKGVGGIDGFYFRSSFDLYKELALINPDEPDNLCDEVADGTG